MAEQRILLLGLIISVPHVTVQSSIPDLIKYWCPTNARVNLTGEAVDPATNDVVQSGYVFPLNSRWNESDETFACACYSKPVCSPVYCPDEKNVYLKIDKDCKQRSHSTYDIEFDTNSIGMLNTGVMLESNSFRMKNNHGSCLWLDYEVENVKFAEYGFLIRKNGSIYIPHSNITAMYNFDRFCLCSDVDFVIYEPTCYDVDDDAEPMSNSKANIARNGQWFDPCLNLLLVMAIEWSTKFNSRL